MKTSYIKICINTVRIVKSLNLMNFRNAKRSDMNLPEGIRKEQTLIEQDGTVSW